MRTKNTAALPINALLHSIVSTHSCMATIDIVDYYLGALLPSCVFYLPSHPHQTRPSSFPPSLPRQTFLFCDVKTVPGLPQLGLLSQLCLVALLSQHGFSKTSTYPHALPPPHPLHRLHPCSGRFPLNWTTLFLVFLPSMNSKFIDIYRQRRPLNRYLISTYLLINMPNILI